MIRASQWGRATRVLGALMAVAVATAVAAPLAQARPPAPREKPVFFGSDKVSVGPVKARCKLTLRTRLPAGTTTRLEFYPRSFIMPWENEEPPDTWQWRPVARVVVAAGRVTHTLKITSDGYWRYWSPSGVSEPRFIDVYPTSDLSDPGRPGSTNECRL